MEDLGGAVGGLSLEKVHSRARRALLMVRDGLERLERLELAAQQPSSSSSPSYRGIGGLQDAQPTAPDIVENLKKEIGELQVASADMDRMWRNQVLAKGQRDLWKRRIEQVAEEVESLKAGIDRYLLRQHRRQVEAQERAELFRRTRGDGAHILQVNCCQIVNATFLDITQCVFVFPKVQHCEGYDYFWWFHRLFGIVQCFNCHCC